MSQYTSVNPFFKQVKRNAATVRQILDPCCMICLEPMSEGRVARVARCGHSVHQACLIPYLVQQISSSKPSLCPRQGCGAVISQRFLRQSLDKEKFGLFLNYGASQGIRSKGFLYNMVECPVMDCREVLKFDYPWASSFLCSKLKQRFCSICYKKEHPAGMTCQDYSRKIGKFEEEMLSIEAFKRGKFQQCRKCRHLVQKSQGCNHMVCKCLNEFCYICGGGWPKCQCVQKRQRGEL